MTDPRGIRDPDSPGSPYYNTPIPPKASRSGSAGPAPFVADTIADQAVPLPVLYGTMKVPLHLIEKFAPIVGDPPAWTTATQWAAGAFCKNGNNAYKTPGNSTGTHTGGLSGASAPTHTSGTVSDGGMDWTYVQQLPCPVYTQVFVAALCEGPIEGESGLWWDKEKFTTVAAKGLVLHTGPDGSNQSLAAESASYDSSGYQHTALVAASVSPQLNCFTGTQAELPEAAVEVIGLRFGATTPDPAAADMVNDILTSFRRGSGLSPSRVDVSITGTAAGSYRVYCDAAGLRFSMLLDNQRSALAWLNDILVATNSDAVWSQGALKIKPLGDTAIPSPVFGATGYVPDNAAVYNFTTDDFLGSEKPVSYRTTPDSLIYNRWPVQYVDRQLGYVQTTVDFPDQANADLLGVKDAGTVALPLCFPDGTRPTMISRVLAQRSGRVTVIYTWDLDWRYILCDPTDVATLTEALTGLAREPVRITDIEEQSDGTLRFTAESYPAGVAAATGYQPQTGSGYVSNDVVTTQALPTTVDGVKVGIKDQAVLQPAFSQSGFGALRSPNYAEDGSGNPTAGAKIGLTGTGRTKFAPGTFQVGGYVFNTPYMRMLRALDGTAVADGGNGITWYRGNIDPSVLSGVPDISNGDGAGERVQIISYAGVKVFTASTGGGSMTGYPLEIDLFAKTNADNLDALRMMEIALYTSAGVLMGSFREPFPDRKYQVPGTPSNGNNGVAIRRVFFVGDVGFTAAAGSPFNFNGYARIQLQNAYGISAARDFGPGPNTTAAWAGGATIGGGAGSPPGGSGGGGSSICPAPQTRILLANGQRIDAVHLFDGALVQGADAARPGVAKVGIVRRPAVRWAKDRYALALTDGRVLRFSRDHRLVGPRGWTAVQQLRGGDVLLGDTPGTVKQVVREGPGQVVEFVVEGCHTYFSDGVLSHNVKTSIP